MKPSTIVTIIIPNYNHERFIKQRIESVLNQSFQDFELFILDDCSADNSLSIINHYSSHPKIKGIIKNDINSGSVFKQWVKGLSMAKGEYVWIAESDDYSDPDFLKHTIAALEENYEAGLAFSNSVLVDEEGIEKTLFLDSNAKFSIPNDQVTYVLDNQSKFFNYYVNDLVICNVSSVLFRRKALECVDHILLGTFKNAGDLFVYISLALQNQLIYVNKPLNYFRKHPGNTTKSNAISGVLHSERVKIATYFSERLLTFKGGKQHLKVFLKRHFLTAIESGYSVHVRQFLKKLYALKVFHFKIYIELTFYSYILDNKILKLPFSFRNGVKMRLESLLMDIH